MKQLCVYIVRCSDNSYYTGVTNNIDRRLFEHNTGLNKESYTYKRRPVKLVFHYLLPPHQAIQFEKQIKGWRREKKEALINDKWDLLPELAKKKSKNGFEIKPTHHFDKLSVTARKW